MSEYDEKRENNAYDYDTHSRPHTVSSYSGYAQVEPSYDAHHQHHFVPATQASQPHSLPNVAHLPYLSPVYTSRDHPYQQLEENYTETRTRPSIDLTSHTPYRSSAGEILRITFKSLYELPSYKYNFILEFGTIAKLNATLSPSHAHNPHDSHFHYNLTARVPELSSESQTMPLMIDVQDENALHIERKNAGFFYYGAAQYQSFPTEARKRKLSEDSSIVMAPSAKRPSSHALQPSKFKDSSSVYSAQQHPIQSASPYGTPLFAIPAIDRSTIQRSPYTQPSHPSSSRSSYGAYRMSPTVTPQSIKIRSPTISYGSYPPMSHGQSSQMAPQTISSAPHSRALSTTTPTWVRTTELRQQQSTPRAANYGSEPRFNPFAQYPDTKANLELVGNLGSMCEGWTSQERAEKRRLVEFSRSQTGNTITASFGPVNPEERTPDRAVVSCIWWARRKEHFVTSVDTIALLEGLVAVRFTVEEKNRIRRNLEGFKPYTVAKNKEESDDIFRLIMGFGAPKPRNIEKDIKIFPWSSLAHALKKIISKYSASYASTSSSIGPPVLSANYGSSLTEAVEHQASPTSTTSSHVHAGYGGGMTSTSLSPTLAGASSGFDSTGSSHDLRTSSSLPHLYGQGNGSQWAATGHNQYPSYSAGLPQSAPSRSWDLENYINQQQHMGTHVSAGPPHHPPVGYYERAPQRHDSTASQHQSGSSRYMEQHSRP